MDLLTPARVWAAPTNGAAESNGHVERHEMPLLQRWVMMVSLVGPFVGLLVAGGLLWQSGPAAWFGWPQLLMMGAMYALTGFGVTLGFHRLLTHRSFQTYRPVRLTLAVLGSAAAQGMVINWCATHRRHHQCSDREGDPHSPHLHGGTLRERIRGMWHAHVAWCLDPDLPGLARSVPDLVSDPALLMIDRFYFLWVAIGLLTPGVALAIYERSWHGFVSGLLWGGLVRLFLMQHVTWSVNSVCHVWGTRPFRNADHSRNNYPVAVLSLGEGWHNNHHAFPTSARHGLRWWQLDLSYLVITAMRWVGLAWDVNVPSRSAQEAKTRQPPAATAVPVTAAS